MSKPHGIIVFGANGSGKTTLGRELAHILNFKHMDHEDYHFEKSSIPYTVERSYEDCLNLMLADIDNHRSFVISAVTGDFDEKIPLMYDLAVFITAPIETRIKRVEQREYERHGERIREGGDMYEQHLKFIEFVASRSLSRIELWAETLACPVIHVDGMVDYKQTAADIASRFYPVLRHYDTLIDENNDPVHDPKPLKEYMDKWDGEAFIDAMQITPNKSVLEIGVGTGRLAARVYGKYKSFIGIDISAKTIERAKENLKDFPNVRLICGEYLSHPFDKRFDVIFSSLTFMHIRDKQTAIKKAADLLNHGGRFVLSISKEQKTLLDFGNRQIEVYPDTPDEITSLLIGAGLTIEKQFETEFAVVFVSAKGV